VENPQIANRRNETIITPNIFPRIRLLPQIKNIKPTKRPNNPIIDPNAIKNSTPESNLSK
jgi:hypothetical protein